MPLDGLQLGHYRLVRSISSGGMGEVYLAADTRINRQVAIKVVRTEASPYPDANATKEAARLFQREMKTIALLDHPHILPLFDFGEESVNKTMLVYMVMPFRQEGSLTDWLQQRNQSKLLSPADVWYLIQQAANALQHAHSRQVIHQDVKPSNFLIHTSEDPRRPDLLLADFGVAKFTSATSSMSHTIRGTPTYMAPEQWGGEPVPATDQYALAIMAYELLAGHPPFQGPPMRLMHLHATTQPQPPSTFNPQISPALDAVILRALAKQPADRFPSIATFAQAFRGAVQGTPAPGSTIVGTTSGSTIAGSAASGADIRATLAISRTEALTSTSRTLTLPGGRRVNVFVPAGTQDGQMIRLEGLGEPSSSGGPTGSLILTITITQTEKTVSSAENARETVRASNANLQAPGYGAIASRPLQAKGKIVLLIGLALLIIASGLGVFYVFHTNPITNPNSQSSVSSPTTNPSSNSGITPTSRPQPGSILYRADWSSGMNGWIGSSEWKVVNGKLLSDGTNAGYNVAPAGSDSIISPYQPSTTNYAVEARMQIVDTTNNCYLAIRARVQADGSGYDGYFVGFDSYFGDADIAFFSPGAGFSSITSTSYSPGLGEHLYRAEFRDNQITLKIDNNIVLQTIDNRFINTGRVGLENGGCQISVSSFQVIAL